ncbi:MAG: NAD-dependent DNA ligase LigA [Candidatus Staskawiczbacteria bacterium]|nr:NAD-dependent DNA ligase LigA [Candidatus Staskawiczbacteria bacterium]
MDKQQAKQRINKLREVINHHRYLYHVQDKQEISDSALDSLKKELFDLEQQFPDLVTADSPTQRVGGKPLKAFKKIKHSQRMLSFNDGFSKTDMEDWQERFMKLVPEKDKNKINYYCELKIDGLAIELIYKDGYLQTGATRGDGNVGEDITQNLKTVEAIPLTIDVGDGDAGLRRLRPASQKEIIVRGEVFITKKEFKRINKEQKEKGLAVYANPRNIAAGSVRQLDPRIASSRKLDSFAYELLTDFGQKTHEDKHKILKNLGFKTNKHNKYCKSLEEVLHFREHWIKEREKLDYEIDGIVVIINNNEIFEKLGFVGKAPRGAIAYKFPQAQSTTKVLDIIVQVGRTGAMTPVAILEPVQVTGITISRATLHNEDEIKRLGLKIGDTVIVGRAGDVIPDIIKVLPELRTGHEKNFKMPKKCPSCGTKLIKIEGEVLLRCPNKNCFAQKRRNFYHFVSRTAFNMDGLGPKIIDRLLDEGLVQTPADLFELKEGDLSGLERFAEKSAENLIKSIKEKNEITLSRFIYALGIRNVGEETAIDLAKHFGSIKKIREAKLEDFDRISDIGPVVSKSIYEWFNEKDNVKFLEKLQKFVKTQNPKPKTQKLDGLNFVLTGTLESMSRDEAKAKIRELGGDISESVSSKTSYVVVGLEPGSKAEKAKKLGVKTLSEKEFFKLIHPVK